MKTKFFLIISFFFLSAYFHTQILGAVIRFALHSTNDCQLVYRSLGWEQGKLAICNAIVSTPTFHAHVEKATLQIDWKSLPYRLKAHLAVEGPHVTIRKKPEFPNRKNPWFDWTVSVSKGILEWEGSAHFSYEGNRLSLKWIDSGVDFIFKNGLLEAHLDRFRAKLLRPIIPLGDLPHGYLTGSVTLRLEDQKLVSAHLQLQEVEAILPQCAVRDLTGSFSYRADLGGKWELSGTGSSEEKNTPFICSGKGFIRRKWLESKIEFPHGFVSANQFEDLNIELNNLDIEQMAFLQGAASIFWPELGDWNLVKGSLEGKGRWGNNGWDGKFSTNELIVKKGENEIYCQKAQGQFSQDGGNLIVISPDFEVKVGGEWKDWKGDVKVQNGCFSLSGGWDGEKFPIAIKEGNLEAFSFFGSGWFDPHFDFSLKLEGEWSVLQKKIPFSFPHLIKQGSEYTFDFRLERQLWNVLRLAGTTNGKQVQFSERCHLLGAPLQFTPSPLGSLDVRFHLPWKAVLAAHPLVAEWGVDLHKIPFQAPADIHFHYNRGYTEISAHGTDLPFDFFVKQNKEGWDIDLQSDLTLCGQIREDGRTKGIGRWKTGIETEFDGRILPGFRCDLSLRKIFFDLALLPIVKMEGMVEGQGHFIYNGDIESDLDLVASGLKINAQLLENEGPIHLSYSSLKGILFHGINLHGPFDCKVELLEYDFDSSQWMFHNSQMHLPGSFLTHRFLKFLDPNLELNFTADLQFASDFSTFSCKMREGSIPYANQSHHIENLSLYWDHSECRAQWEYLNDPFKLRLHIDEQVSGRLILGNEETPLTVDWEYEDQLIIHSIEGSFGGVEASFHSENINTLIGSARLNCTVLSQFVPSVIAEAFDVLEMGKGFELKGRLKIEKNVPSFSGLLAGKSLELFGFQFRTLLAQIDLSRDRVRIYDLKISDSAGMLKVDEIIAEGKGDDPWTLSIPYLAIYDLRPSLLQKPGEPIGPISPLVVREFKLTGLQGLLDESFTYTAKGQLRFINSYKREETVFDLPANVLSRIVGLDLELLIPVCGDLVFELKEGRFILNELTHAFSEGERSEFFLEMEPPPSIDLDGNLQICIKMKQFVLFKITESFIISIEGKLDDPKFHLRKKRLFGLI